MKKMTLTVAMLLSATYLFAQNNVSEATQNADFSKSVITQTGQDHFSKVTQNSNANNALKENLATVTQLNLGGAHGNESSIVQGGNTHTSTVTQIGDNKARVYIGGLLTANSASSVAKNVDNETSVVQTGTGNEGAQSIYRAISTNTFLDLVQVGTGNVSVQVALNSIDSEGKVVQGTTNNDASQTIEGTNEYASILQVGSNNQAIQVIEGINSANNDNYITQTGSDNFAGIKTIGGDNFFRVTQTGDRNTLEGFSGELGKQEGDRNEARFLQTGNDNTFVVSQVGNDNTIEGYGITAGLGANQLGNRNIASISQDGDDNLSQSLQKGSDNTIDLTQTGDDNTSVVRQYTGLFSSANRNNADITQSGMGNSSNVNQNGNNNSVVVTQTGGMMP